MTDQEISELPTHSWMASRIPLRDALSTFVPDGPEPEPIIAEMQSRLGQSAWYPVEGGHRVLVPYDGGGYDASRFIIQPLAWDHEHCSVCQEHIPAMMLCHVTKPEQPYILLCSVCYDRYVVSTRDVAEQFAALEPPPPASISDGSVHQTLASPPVPVPGGGR